MTNNNTRPRRTSVPKSKRKKQRSIGGGGGRVSRTPDTHSVASSSSSTWSSDKAAAAAKQRNAVKNELNDIIDNDQDGFWTRPSNAEERQRIREFWLQLREDERRSLIKIEKEAVLKKMKEQQRHSCNCSVCGKKRTAIEDELEVLYDAYYEELEQYTNNNQNNSGINPLTGTPVSDMEDEDDDNDDDDEEDPDYESDYDDDDDDDDIENDRSDDDDDDDEEDEYSSDHLAFGNSLTVKGGILTVADDLLQNNGKKFLDMMERLAERRIKKEDPLDYRQDDDEDDEDDDEYLDDDDYEDEEEEDARTELQRIEEGRRTFQIFAARMFEQRVLAAYREKVAQERQQRLIQELEEEDRLRQEKELKRQKEKERKKDKKMQLKKQKEEERRAKEAAKKAEEERLRAEKQKKLEEERQRREQERRQKEEARLRREEEKRRRLQEERERAAEKERKRQEREMKRKQERKEQEDRDRQEQQFKQEKERRERELKEEMERRDRALQERKLKWEKEEQRRKSQQTLIDALMGPSSSSSLSSSLSSSSSSITTASDTEVIMLTDHRSTTTASSPKTKTNRSIAPIGPPSSNQLHRPPPTVVCNDPSNERPAAENSFFSNFLFGPSKDKNQDKTIKERSDIQTSNDTPKANWTNGWTASTFLSEDFHGRLFGNVLPDRNTVLLEKAKAAYNKLDEISRTATFLGPVPPFYTLAQIHRMMIDLYCDCSATIQDLYQAMVMNPASPFRCTSDLQHGVLVHYQEPGRFGFPNAAALSPPPPPPAAVPGSYSPFQPPMGHPLPLFKGMT
ncbi:stress response protein nst1 [Lichtheimia corymbifera JMRC:FSU:9682]|uniref:Stress response protein NST1 n=1 Tax=Lichtheimia corymbifera JMRC:FSU:9682 TaxID=1263082 RepID=A0A068RQN4_9FUNG|nr:stress response protein nst1 [Lichtheimia corymbifera JMRC:FSU:9682]